MKIYSTPAHNPLLRQQLADMVDRLAGRALFIFGSIGDKPRQEKVDQTVDLLVDGLASEGVSGEAISRLIWQYLVDAGRGAETDFWESPLGRSIAWHIGYPRPVVPRTVAAAVLGVSRQRAHQYDDVDSPDLLRERFRRSWREIQLREARHSDEEEL